MSIASATLSIPTPFNEPLETLLVHGTAVNVMTLVGFTALLYDHFITFTDEIHLIWRARKGIVSTIFLLNRYIVPMMLALDIFETFGDVSHLLTFCKVWTVIQSYLTITSFISVHAIVAWRVYAIYNGHQWILRLLWIVGSLNFLVSAAITTASLIPIISTLQPYHHACVGSVPDYIWSIWLPSVVFETLLFGLTVVAMHVVLRCCNILLPLSLMVWALAGPDLLGLARYFALAMVNIAGSRLILNLKAYADARQGGDSDLDWDVVPPINGIAYPPKSSACPVLHHPSPLASSTVLKRTPHTSLRSQHALEGHEARSGREALAWTRT
ncbi:uncharacterized protein BXZ73DRAFT_104959 [Epithele typhae]|uniref:uncharacterized protein n=1 Tax=Epithele typhae TaxID=378194 RepID=UPI002007F808|nr:uncharacterized protein BXZ73DRAFT_104959 [Epithele typhae]KAH9919487.1 hypothetical protein BXZ73DRAFT_104959 [Epithele typhae]